MNLGIFFNTVSDLEKLGPFFQVAFPFPSLPSVAINESKSFQCSTTVFTCKTTVKSRL